MKNALKLSLIGCLLMTTAFRASSVNATETMSASDFKMMTCGFIEDARTPIQ